MIRRSVLAAMAVLSMLGSSASAIDLLTPASLSLGDKFRFIFATSGTTTASSANIADYDSFVTAQAGSTTYQGNTIVWASVGSTTAVDARTNVGGFSSNVPVYLVTGTKVADNLGTGTNGLWSGTVLNAVNYGIDGLQISSGTTRVWTGSNADGTANSGSELGASSVIFGSINSTTGMWLFVDSISNSQQYRMYGISRELTVVPEPGTFALALGAAGVLALRLRRKAK